MRQPPFAWEIRGRIKVIEKAEAVLEKEFARNRPSRLRHRTKTGWVYIWPEQRKDLARRKLRLLGLRRERRRLAFLYLRPAPRGRRMDHLLAYSVYWLGEEIKEKTSNRKPNWELVADLISECLKVPMDAHQALKFHQRFKSWRESRR